MEMMKKDIAGRYCMQYNHFMKMNILNFLTLSLMQLTNFKSFRCKFSCFFVQIVLFFCLLPLAGFLLGFLFSVKPLVLTIYAKQLLAKNQFALRINFSETNPKANLSFDALFKELFGVLLSLNYFSPQSHEYSWYV